MSGAAGSARLERINWGTLAWLIPSVLVALAAIVLVVRWLRGLGPVEEFLTQYPGHQSLPASAPLGLPVWLDWQHFLNVLFMVLIIRSGWAVRTTQRPTMYWTRNNAGWIRTTNPPKKISIDLWFHLMVDAFWVLNGVVFYVLLFSTGQWMRIVPTNWGVFPNAVSAAIQYASLDWPTEDGWANYNGLQLLAYFVTVFVAAPLAIITGLRMSGAWPAGAKRLNRVYSVELARAVHFPVMLYFVGFVIVHVALVLATGALQNLNHMYGHRDVVDWVGFSFFAVSIVLIAAVWVAARPILLQPIAALMGRVGR